MTAALPGPGWCDSTWRRMRQKCLSARELEEASADSTVEGQLGDGN